MESFKFVRNTVGRLRNYFLSFPFFFVSSFIPSTPKNPGISEFFLASLDWWNPITMAPFYL